MDIKLVSSTVWRSNIFYIYFTGKTIFAICDYHSKSWREFTCGSAELSCLWSTSLSWSTSWSLVCDWMRVSCVSRKDSSSLSLSSNIFTISCSKLDSASVPFWEPLWELTESPSFMVGITSHIILLGVLWSLSQIRNCFWIIIII